MHNVFRPAEKQSITLFGAYDKQELLPDINNSIFWQLSEYKSFEYSNFRVVTETRTHT